MDKKQKIILAILAGVLMLAVLTTVLLVRLLETDEGDGTGQTVIGEFTRPPFEETAKTGFDEPVPSESGYTSLAITKEFVAALCGNVFVKDGKAEIYFTSHKDNTAWARVQLFDESGKAIGECGILKPGEHVQAITLSEVPKENIKMTVKIILYEPETYYSEGTRNVAVSLIVK